MLHSPNARSIGGGAAAGVVAGTVLSLYHLVMALAADQDPWPVFKGAGAPFLGGQAMAPGFDGVAVTVGLLSHLAVSAVWGALFGLIFFGLPKAATLVAGLGWGVIVWLGMFYVVLPVVGLGAMAASGSLVTVVLDHLLFGVVVALAFLPFQATLPRRPTAGL